MFKSTKLSPRERSRKRIRKKISGTAQRPRLSVYRSNTSIYAQLVDDVTGMTLVAANSKALTEGNKTEQAREVGRIIAAKALEAGITKVVFDRSGYIYHGRIKALAEGARGARKEDGTNELLQF